MAAKNLFKKNKHSLTKIKHLVKKNLKIEPLDIDPTKIIKNTQNKIKGPFYKKGKLFFSISKPISDTHHVISKNMLKILVKPP